MKGAWISSPLLIISGVEYYKCSACGDLQRLDIFDNHMRYCSTCGDYKTKVHRTVQVQNVIKKW